MWGCVDGDHNGCVDGDHNGCGDGDHNGCVCVWMGIIMGEIRTTMGVYVQDGDGDYKAWMRIVDPDGVQNQRDS